MIEIRPSHERGRSRADWLDGRHSFSFAHYFDRRWRGFGPLLVLNEDRIAPASGFGPHPHADMEIVTLPLAGVLEHRDSTGSSGLLRPGIVQRMSAGTGIVHSEMNPSPDETLHLLQIWILPERRGLEPAYEEIELDRVQRGWIPVASRDGGDHCLRIHQDAALHLGRLAGGESRSRGLDASGLAWLQITAGAGRANGLQVAAGDGVALRREDALELSADEAGLEGLLLEFAAA
jgi:redox-sensitive bicupin YhaK (pirin superfamily)